MVYLLKMVIFHGYVSHNQMVRGPSSKSTDPNLRQNSSKPCGVRCWMVSKKHHQVNQEIVFGYVFRRNQVYLVVLISITIYIYPTNVDMSYQSSRSVDESRSFSKIILKRCSEAVYKSKNLSPPFS